MTTETTETTVQPDGVSATPAPGPSPAAAFGSGALSLAERIMQWTGRQLVRPRTRTFVVGIALILVAALFVGHSFWTAPLVIVGILMLVVAWVGSRLEGRFAVEWSEAGAGFELHARFKSTAAHPRQLTESAAPHAADTPTPNTHSAPSHGDVIEGEAHTMEIDAEELRALVAAVEAATLAAQTAEPVHAGNGSSSSTQTTTSQTIADEL